MRLSPTAFVKKQFVIACGLTALLSIPALALHFDRQALTYATIDELYAPGKEVKAWSDTSIIITSIVFKYLENVSWYYTVNKTIPCTLSVGDTFKVSVYAGFVRNVETPLVDSLVVVTKSLVLNFMPLQVAAIPHRWVTTKTLTGPVSDSAGKTLRFSRDSVSCTYRHTVFHTFLWDDGFQAVQATGVRAAFHSWSLPGTYNVRSVVSCWGDLTPDTTPAHQVTILPSGIQAKAGAYKSGFYVFTGGSPLQRIDFSQTGVASPQEADVRFEANGANTVVAPYGIINLGTFNSLPIAATMGFGGFVPDTSSDSRKDKPTYDSIVTSIHVVCPATLLQKHGGRAGKVDQPQGSAERTVPRIGSIGKGGGEAAVVGVLTPPLLIV
jgi:hypothetical protein